MTVYELLVFEIFICLTIASVSSYKLVEQFHYNGHVLEAPVSHFPLQAPKVSTANALSGNISELYSILRLNGSIVVDVYSGWGISYFPLSEAVGPAGVLVALEVDQRNFDCLRNNSKNKSTWDRTLLVHGDPRESVLGRRSVHSISSVFKSIDLDCPRLIRINDHVDLKLNDVFYSLVGGISLIRLCRPMVLIDLRRQDTNSATAVVEFLSLLDDSIDGFVYEMRWFDIEYDLKKTMSDGDTHRAMWRTTALLAVPRGVEIDSSPLWKHSAEVAKPRITIGNSSNVRTNMWDDIFTHLNRSELAVVSQSILNADGIVELVDISPFPFSNNTNGNAHQWPQSQAIDLKEVLRVNVYLRDITPPESALGVLLGLSAVIGDNGDDTQSLQLAAGGLRDTLVRKKLLNMSVAYHFSARESMNIENLEGISVAHCSMWLHRISASADADAAQSRVLFEASALLAEACISFLSKRLHSLRRMFILRALTLQYPDLLLDPKPDGDSNFHVPDNVATATGTHLYYQLSGDAIDISVSEREIISPGRTMESWFAHAPFEARYDPASCGEPIWCAHTAEMQRRIHAWQNPEKQISKSTLPQGHDWSTATTRSCASAKFLVYEPPSDKHGIGALLELIAVTFRYAICLDRILILNTIKQESTLTKWIHPGCQGSFLECYFQPISECTLSAHDIAEARTSSDGFEFGSFPQREERVLVLKGMPLEGKCTLCFSEWPADSRFFDGLILGGGSFNGSDKKHLKHSAAFRSSVKETWASQFLRYIMRPRAWVQEAVSQIVHYSMQSPVPTNVSAVVSVNNQSYIQVRNFPERYLSLHVRFGMKAAEAALEPLARYMEFIARKLPHMRDIFLSTETEAVVGTLRSEYPEYRFHALRYPRKEFLDLGLHFPHMAYHQRTDFVDEMLFSLANLYVSSEAHAFVGTLSSNWCVMIMHLERTRGDGGYEYFSMDEGSTHSSCF